LWKNLLTNVKIEQIVKRFAARGSFAFKPKCKQIILSEEKMKKLLKHKRNISIFLVMALVLTFVPGSMFIEDDDIGYVDLTGNSEINLTDSDISTEDNDETVLSYTEDDEDEDINSDGYVETNLNDSDVLTEDDDDSDSANFGEGGNNLVGLTGITKASLFDFYLLTKDNIGLTEILSGADDVAGVDTDGYVGVEQTGVGIMAVNVNTEKRTPELSNLYIDGGIPGGHVFNNSSQGIGNIVTNISGFDVLDTFEIGYQLNGEGPIVTAAPPTIAGTYTVYAVFTETDDVNAAEVNLGTYTIAPLDITTGDGYVISGTAFNARTYNGSAWTPTGRTVTHPSAPGVNVTGSWSSVTNVWDQTAFNASGNFTGSTAAQDSGMAQLDINMVWPFYSIPDGVFEELIYNGNLQTPVGRIVMHGSLTVTGTWDDVRDVVWNTRFTSNGNFTGSTGQISSGMQPFDITSDLGYELVGAEFTSRTYNGSAWTPTGRTVSHPTFPSVNVTGSWNPVTNVTDQTTFTATGNFTGTTNAYNPNMSPRDLGTSPIVTNFQSMTYTGAPQTPVATTFTVGDFAINAAWGTWSNVENVGDTTTFTPNNPANFTGAVGARTTPMLAFNISSNGYSFGGEFAEFTYNGSAQTPERTVTHSELPALSNIPGTWSQVTDVGEFTTFTPTAGNFIGTITGQNPGMSPLNVGTGSLNLTFSPMTFTGSAQTPVTTTFTVNTVPVTGGSWSSVTNVSDTTTFTTSGGNFTGMLADQATLMSKADRAPIAVSRYATDTLNVQRTYPLAGYVSAYGLLNDPLNYDIGSGQTNGTGATVTFDVDPSTGILSYTVESGDVGETATASVTVSGFTNYNDITINITVTITDKILVNITGVTVTNRAWNGNPIAPNVTGLTVTPEAGGSAVTDYLPLIFTYRNISTGAPSTTAPTAVGSYELVISTDSDDPKYAGESYTIAFTISRVSQNAPTGLGKTDETGENADDGTITGVNATMEYKSVYASVYTPITGTTITGLAPGTYHVRFAGGLTHYPGTDAIIVIEKYIPFTEAPLISGQVAGTEIISLTVGYTALTSTYLITGTPVPALSVSITGIPGATITNAGVLTIPAGLPVGNHTVVITASNGVSPDATMTVTVAVHTRTPEPTQEPGTISDVTQDALIVLNANFYDMHAANKNGTVLTLTQSENGTTVYLSGYPGFTGNIGEAVSGSTIITIYEAFLQTLPNGTYTFSVSFRDSEGVIYASPEVTYVISRLNNPNNPPVIVQNNPGGLPQTGVISSITLWVILLLVSVAVTISIIVWLTWFKKKEHSN
jgi:hypothetical protein